MNLDLFQEIMRDEMSPIKLGHKDSQIQWKGDNSMIFTPRSIVDSMLDLLPAEVWSPNTKFLDPCVKSGVFLCAIRDRLDKALQTIPGYEDPVYRMRHILNNQIYGISLVDNELMWSIQRLVYGEIFVDNLQYLEKYRLLIQKLKFSDILEEVKKEEIFGMNKFDVVIGNPPYQDDGLRIIDDKGNRQIKDSKLYRKFMLLASLFADRYSCMIVKNKWMTQVDKAGTRGFTDVRQHLLVDKHCKKLVDYPTVGEVFKDIGTSVCYYLSNEKGQSDCEYTRIGGGQVLERYVEDFSKTGMILKSKIVTDIANKTYSIDNFGRLELRNKPCGYETSELPMSAVTDAIKGRVKFINAGGDWYVSEYDMPNNLINQIKTEYKVVAGEKVNVWVRDYENVVTNIMLLKPMETCSGTWTQLFTTKNKEEAENFVKYLKTKFCRLTIKAGYSAYGRWVNEYLRFCPLQDFTSNSDIDWSKSIEDIDKQLYRKYNLTQEEIDYIEKTIKPMT